MSPAARRTTLCLLTIIYGFGFADRVVIALVAQQLKADFAISDLQVGLLGGTAFAIVNVAAALPLARLADRTSRRLVTAGSLLVGSLFTILCGAAASFGQLLALRLGMAAGSAGTEAPGHALISDLYPPERRASALSIFMLGVPLASIIGSAAGAAIAESHGWRATFLAFGGAGMVVALVAMLVTREPRRASDADPLNGGTVAVAARLWRSVHFRWILLGTAAVSLASFGLNTFLPAFFTRSHGVGIGEAGLLFGLVAGIASTVGSLLGGFGSERLARRHGAWLIGFPGVGLAIAAPLIAAGLMAPTLAAAVPLLLVGSVFTYMAMAPAISITHGLLGARERATGSALFLLFIHLIGQGFGPPLAGWVSDTMAAWHFGSPGFASACAGAAGQVAGSRCGNASAAGLRDGILCFLAFYLAGALLYGLAARRMTPRPSSAAMA